MYYAVIPNAVCIGKLSIVVWYYDMSGGTSSQIYFAFFVYYHLLMMYGTSNICFVSL